MTAAGIREERDRSGGTGGISQLLDRFLDEQALRTWPVSVAMTTLALRQRAKQCDLTDQELAELVAIRAVERGHNVVFDADLLERVDPASG